MRVDLHNHTTLCNHANGTMEEYVIEAINKGIDIFGFSEHAPMDFDPKYRMQLSEKTFYEESVLSLREKYSNDIKILLGYEVDFMLDKKLMLDEIIYNKNIDYLIGSVHFITEQSNSLWGFDNPEFIGKYKDKNIDDIWQIYFDTIEEMAKTNLFDIVGHFDLIKVFKFLPNKDIRLIAKKALKEIKKSNMVLEINTAGLRKPIKETYPSYSLLEEAYDMGIEITFSSDAHEIEQIGFKYEEARSLAKKIGFNKCITFNKRDKETVTF